MRKQNDDYWYLNHKLPVTTHKPTTEIKFTQNPINFATGGDDGARTQRKPRNWTGQRPNIRLPPTHVTVTVTSQRVRKLSGIYSPPKPYPTWQSNPLCNTQKVSERLGEHKTRKHTQFHKVLNSDNTTKSKTGYADCVISQMHILCSLGAPHQKDIKKMEKCINEKVNQVPNLE